MRRSTLMMIKVTLISLGSLIGIFASVILLEGGV